MIDPVALKTEIANDPMTLGYAALVNSGNDAALANLLNQRPGAFAPSKNWTGSAPLVPIARVLQWGATGPLAAISAAQSNTNAALASIAIASIIGFKSLQIFDVSDPYNLASLNEFVAVGIITQTQMNSLVGLGTVPASRAEVLFGIGTVVGINDIGKALRGS